METVMDKAAPQAGPERPAASDRLHEALDAFDRANAADPNREIVDGEEVPKELIYGRRMSAWLDRLYPGASEALCLAARCQHIERWLTPRETYPEGRVGYLTWRRDLKRYHAERAGKILSDLGYPPAVIARVQSLVRKERLKQEEEAQVLEDVVCVVFLAHYLADFAERHESDKVVEILRKTWAKMSPLGHRAALSLPLEGALKTLVETALAGERP
jgi:hypothetical protein